MADAHDQQPIALSAEEIAGGLMRLRGWEDAGSRLVRDFQFADFVAALGFIVEVGALAERAGHHPEIINVYGHVRISLWTHEVNAVTMRDLRLAEAISARVPWLRSPAR